MPTAKEGEHSEKMEIKQGYSKIKVLELMLFLSVYDLKEASVQKRTLSSGQVSLAKNVVRYLTEHMEQRCTLD